MDKEYLDKHKNEFEFVKRITTEYPNNKIEKETMYSFKNVNHKVICTCCKTIIGNDNIPDWCPSCGANWLDNISHEDNILISFYEDI